MRSPRRIAAVALVLCPAAAATLAAAPAQAAGAFKTGRYAGRTSQGAKLAFRSGKVRFTARHT